VADDGDRLAAGDGVLAGEEAASENRPHAEDVEVVRADQHPPRRLGLTLPVVGAGGRREREASQRERREPRKGLAGARVLAVDVEVRRVGQVGAGSARRLRHRLEADQAVHLRHGANGTEDDTLHPCVNRRRRADAEAEAQDDRRRDEWRLAHDAQRKHGVVAQLLQQAHNNEYVEIALVVSRVVDDALAGVVRATSLGAELAEENRVLRGWCGRHRCRVDQLSGRRFDA